MNATTHRRTPSIVLLTVSVVVAAMMAAYPAAALAAVSPIGASDVILGVTDAGAVRDPNGRTFQGVVLNNGTDSVTGIKVAVGWAEDPTRFDSADVPDPRLSPGDWTTFSFTWPADVPSDWSPVVTPYGRSAAPTWLPLQIDGVTPTAACENHTRCYIVKITSMTGVPVTDIRLSLVERSEGEYVQSVDGGKAPARLGPSESAEVLVHAARQIGVDPTVEVRVTALDAGGLLPVYRFYNFLKGTHFYTASETERANVTAKHSDVYAFEGTAYSLDTGSPDMDTPLHRFYNKRTDSHFYTASAAEKDSVLAKYSDTFAYEGVAYNVSTKAAGNTPVYRFFNVRTGTHFYTASKAEKMDVIAKYPGVFTYEGIAYYLAP